MLDIIKKYTQKEIVSIYTNQEEPDSFSAGIVQAVDEEMVLINHITPYGLYDGYIVKQVSKVYRIEHNGQYEQKITKLYSFRKQKHMVIDIQDDDVVLSVLEFARQNQLLVAIEILDSGYWDVQGVVKEIDNVIEIVQVNDYGEENGSTFINKNDISELRCDTEEEISMKLLYDNLKEGM